MTLHPDAVVTLSSWRAPTPEQERLRERFVTHLQDHDDGVWRTCFPDHLTAGTLVVDESVTRVLLNLHGKAKRWFAFGGHCEGGDTTLAAAAAREATEESGITGLRLDPVPAHLDEHTVGFCDPRGLVQHLDVRYVAVAPAASVPAVSDESLDVRWWSLDALPELEPEMHELIAVARARFG